jgi:type IV fimbrial biogenesis protein FimT
MISPSKPQVSQLEKGFTLIELMLVIAVAAILAGVAVPQFSSLSQNARMGSARNGLFSAFKLARGIAIAQRAHVVVCASDSNTPSERCGGNWDQGVLVFVDQNRNRQHEANEKVLTQIGAATFAQLGVQGSRRLTSFGPDGRSGGSNQTLALCAPGLSGGLSVVISNAGRVRMGKFACV